MGCGTCTKLLSEGLDLCVRARKLDSIDRRNNLLDWSIDGNEWEKSGRFDEYVALNNAHNPHSQIHSKSATVPMWANDQYEKDLADWENRSRSHLMQGCGDTV